MRSLVGNLQLAVDGGKQSFARVAELVGRAVQHDPALPEDHHVVGQGERLMYVLLDDQQRAP